MIPVKNKRDIVKLAALMVAALAVGALTAGCMNRDSGNVSPQTTADYAPQGTATQTAPAAFDWTKNAAQIEAQLAQISEISQARVVVVGNTALVGVKFDTAYQGEMTERIREMVAARIMAADPQITTVAVTADETDVARVYELSDRALAGKDMDDLKNDVNEIVRNATTLR